MRKLTDEQAAVLRLLRKQIGKVCGVVAEFAQNLAWACEHEQSDPDCPVCELYSGFSEACGALAEVPALLDCYLERGPDPNARKG